MAELMQGKNQYIYFMLQRNLEYVGAADGTSKEFTVAKTPIADYSLSGTVGIEDVSAYTALAAATDRSALTSVTVSGVDEKTGKVTLSAAPTKDYKVFITYHYVYGYVAYAQEWGVSESLDTKEITPISAANAEVMETTWKYEGSMKMWDDTNIEDELMRGIAQDELVTGGSITMADENPIPVPKHNVIIKKKRIAAGQKRYIALKGVKFSSMDETGKGGDLAEKDFKLTVDTIIRNYTPSADSGIGA